MKKIIFLLVFVAFYSGISAQTDTLKLSLSQAIELGLNTRYDAKMSNINVEVAKIRLGKSKSELLPDISGNGKLTYYTKLQPTLIPAGVLGFTEPHKVDMGMKNNTALALDLNYTLFKPGLYTDIKIAKNNLELEKEKDDKNQLNIKFEIADAYNNALIKKLQYNIARENENRYKEYYDLANEKYNHGALIESDMLLAELDYKNAIANSEKQKQNYALSLQYLSYKINIQPQSFILLTDTLQISLNAITNNEFITTKTNNRSEIKQIKIEQTGYNLQLKKAKQNILPSLSLFGNYTYLFQGTKLDYSHDFYWAPVNYVGVKLSVPITASIRNIIAVRECKIKISQTDLGLKQKMADVQYEVDESKTKLSNAIQNLTVAKNNYDLSQKVYELKKQQYNLGAFSYEKLLDTEKSLTNTEQEYLMAVYNYLQALLNYHKALGIF